MQGGKIANATSPLDVGQRIVEQREALGLKQDELAAILNYRSGASVGAWERGEKSPTLQTLVRMAELFSVSTDYLLTGSRLSDASVCEKTGLSQKAIDDLEAWNSSRFTEGLVNYILTQRVDELGHGRVGFSDLNSAVAQAVKARIAYLEETQEQKSSHAALSPSGAYVGDGMVIPYDDIAEGLGERAGSIFKHLVNGYVWEEAIKHAKKEDDA